MFFFCLRFFIQQIHLLHLQESLWSLSMCLHRAATGLARTEGGSGKESPTMKTVK